MQPQCSCVSSSVYFYHLVVFMIIYVITGIRHPLLAIVERIFIYFGKFGLFPRPPPNWPSPLTSARRSMAMAAEGSGVRPRELQSSNGNEDQPQRQSAGPSSREVHALLGQFDSLINQMLDYPAKDIINSLTMQAERTAFAPQIVQFLETKIYRVRVAWLGVNKQRGFNVTPSVPLSVYRWLS